MKKSREKLGQILLNENLITEEQLEKAIEIQKREGARLGETFISLGIVTEKDILVKLKFKKTVSMGELLNDESYDEDGLEIQSDELDEIRDDMSWANTSAQEGADQNEAYNVIIKEIQDVIGYAKKENGQKVWHNKEDGKGGYLIDVDLDLISELSQMEEGEGCDTVVDLFNSALPYYNDGDDCIDVSEPQYGWSGNVTGEDLSSCIESRMSI